MSKNINIQVVGADNEMDEIDKINTKLKDGGSCNWIPEDETIQNVLKVTQNGTYKASGEGLHSFSRVNVKVSGDADSVTGKINGKTYVVSVNSSGKLVYTEVSG